MRLVLLLLSLLPILTLAQRFPGLKPPRRETYLTGSEFERTLFNHLLNSSTVSVLEDDVTLLLTSSNLTYSVTDPDTPFEFIDRYYYFSEDAFHKGNNENYSYSYMCVFNTSDDSDSILTRVTLHGGAPVEEFVFGCENNKDCCGLKCCSDDVLINIIIVGAISIALLLLLLCNILIGFKKRRENRKGTTSSAVYEVGRTNETVGEEIDTCHVRLETSTAGALPTTGPNPV